MLSPKAKGGSDHLKPMQPKKRPSPYARPLPYACLECRTSFKRPRLKWPPPSTLECPKCRSMTYLMSSRFKPPAKDDVVQWKKVAALIAAGFRFGTVGEPYPARLDDVPAFLARHARK